MERLTIPDEPIEGGMRRAIIDAREVRKHAMTVYWQLKKYEDTGLTPEEIMDGRLLTGWIPVTERLPDEGQEVLVTRTSTNGNYVTTDEYDWDYCAWASDADDITAWMPLPEPYKEERTKAYR